MDVRPLTAADEPALRDFLREDPWNRVYLLGILHWYGIAGSRARFTGAFANGRLAAVLAEGREVHCWYASPAAVEPAAAAALGSVLAASRVAVVLGPAPLVEALTGPLPAERRRRTASMVLAVSHEGMREGRPAHAVRRATPADLPALVDLYEGYEFDGYPTRRHVRRALEEQIAGDDLVLAMPVRYGLGYGLPGAARPMPNPDTVFWGGYGGSLVIADMNARACIAYAMNRMAATTIGDMRAGLLAAAMWQALAA